MLDPELVENFLIARLASKVSPLPIDPFPHVTEIDEYRENIDSAIGAVTVAIRRIQKTEASEESGEFVFHVQFTVFKQSFRSTGGHVGIYSIIKSIVGEIDEQKFTIDNTPCKGFVEDAYFQGRSEDLFAYTIEAVIKPKLSRFM